MRAIMDTFGLIVLSVMAVWDIRFRKIPVWVLAGLLLTVIGGHLFLSDVSMPEAAAGTAVGTGFVLVSKATREAFGYADSILILILGIFLGIWELFVLLAAAFSMAALFAAAGLAAGKFSRRISIPFIPFLALSYAGVMILRGVGV